MEQHRQLKEEIDVKTAKWEKRSAELEAIEKSFKDS
jgi:hypothetical protein